MSQSDSRDESRPPPEPQGSKGASRAEDACPIEVEFVDRPDPVIDTLGCRGAGEIGIVGVGAAIANAVWHATGRRVRDLPITIDKLP